MKYKNRLECVLRLCKAFYRHRRAAIEIARIRMSELKFEGLQESTRMIPIVVIEIRWKLNVVVNASSIDLRLQFHSQLTFEETKAIKTKKLQ